MIEYTTPSGRPLCFAAPPGVGSRWVTRACQLAGLGCRQHAAVHGPFIASSGMKVTLVRNPCDWLFHCYVQMRWVDPPTEYLGRLAHLPHGKTLDQGGFDEFVCHYLDKTPGCLSAIHAKYEADAVWRHEDLPWALIELLISMGVPRPQAIGCSSLKTQPGDTNRLEKKTRQAILSAEKELADRYEYFW